MKQLQLRLHPAQAYDENNLLEAIQQYTKLPSLTESDFVVQKRSIDARKKQVVVQLDVLLLEGEKAPALGWSLDNLSNVINSPEVVIVGAGPAGLFAALYAIEKGLKPIVLERGKDVQARRRDLANINKKHIVNPDSNYCFGEGGAGTYSDGKLYTRSKKRGDVKRVLEMLVAFGATPEILIDAHPHIGTNKLPKLIQSIREKIIECGGEVRFDSKVTDFQFDSSNVKTVTLNNNEILKTNALVLATGHSARDIFYLLKKHNVLQEAKPFALGVRIEHSQQLIDQIQYHCKTDRGKYLPAASYSLVEQVKYKGNNVGVFSFCMCPGGFIVPSATAPGEVVVNGMSPSRRDSKYSNSGMVVSVDQNDFSKFSEDKELAALKFQAEVEQKAWQVGGETQVAPAQRVVDFVNKKVSNSLLDTSYQPGLQSADLWEVLPEKVAYVLSNGLVQFGKKMNGYFTNEAQIVGVESRTSSPVRIPRDKESLEHLQIKNMYPCGEGAGYAGGIVSAAMDGIAIIEKVALKLK